MRPDELDDGLGMEEWQISKPRGRSGFGAVDLPEYVRFFNTPGGELDVHLPSDIRLGGVTIRRKGDYYIGQADPRRTR